MNKPDPADTFLEFSADQRVRQVLLMSGRSDDQIESLMCRYAPIEVLVSNILTCKGKHANEICACTADRIEEELAKYPAGSADAPWTQIETAHLIMAAAKPLTKEELPAKLTNEFARREAQLSSTIALVGALTHPGSPQVAQA